MNRYKIIKSLGDGSYGTVFQAENIDTKEMVAIKKMKTDFKTWEDCLNLKEIQALEKLDHKNVVKLNEVIREDKKLFLVFEHMEHNLYSVIKNQKQRGFFHEDQVRFIMKEIFEGLAYVHSKGFVHRDLKPENILVRKEEVKLADFGLARDLNSRASMTQYVSTRWYRAPEIILRAKKYGPEVDIWAAGTIMVELFNLSPAFPGESEIDQYIRISHILGSPTIPWPESESLIKSANLQFVEVKGKGVENLVNNCSKQATHLISQLLHYNPSMRPTATKVLQHPFFTRSKNGEASNPSAPTAASKSLHHPSEDTGKKRDPKAGEKLPPAPRSDPKPKKDPSSSLKWSPATAEDPPKAQSSRSAKRRRTTAENPGGHPPRASTNEKDLPASQQTKPKRRNAEKLPVDELLLDIDSLTTSGSRPRQDLHTGEIFRGDHQGHQHAHRHPSVAPDFPTLEARESPSALGGNTFALQPRFQFGQRELFASAPAAMPFMAPTHQIRNPFHVSHPPSFPPPPSPSSQFSQFTGGGGHEPRIHEPPAFLGLGHNANFEFAIHPHFTLGTHQFEPPDPTSFREHKTRSNSTSLRTFRPASFGFE